jgi:nitroreductase
MELSPTFRGDNSICIIANTQILEVRNVYGCSRGSAANKNFALPGASPDPGSPGKIKKQEIVMIETMNWILKRRSIRVYTDAPVTDEQVETLLRAAMAAPSANNVRPWAFVVVRAAEQRKALAEIHKWSSMCAKAPVVIVVLGEPESSQHWVEDCSAATENLLLAAAGLDLGAVWVAIYPHTDCEARVRQLLEIPESFRVLCLVPVGQPAETKSPRNRFEASKVHVETFGNRD